MVVALLYEMQSPCNCFTLSLSGSDSRRSNSWRDDNYATMEIKVSRLVTMVIMMVLWRWRSKAQDDDGHIMSHILIACDVYLIMLLILLRSTVAL